MICAVHGRTHEIACRSVHANIFLVNVLLTDHSGDQMSVGAGYIASHLGAETERNACGRQDFFIRLSNPLADSENVDRRFLRPVGDADAAGQIDKLDRDADGIADLANQPEQLARERRVIFVFQRAAGSHAVQAKMPNALFPQNGIRIQQLLLRHTKFGVIQMPHNIIRDLEFAGVIAAADSVGNTDSTLHVIDLGQIIQIDNRTDGGRRTIFLRQRLVGGENDVVLRHAGVLSHYQLWHRRAVCTAAKLRQQPQNGRRGRRFDGKILTKAVIPRKGPIQLLHTTADTGFIIDIEGRGIGFTPVLRLRKRKREHTGTSSC